jgi:hypothetical protein
MSNGSEVEADTTDLLRHLALERVSPQWAVFLELLSAELQAQLTSAEYRHLLRRLGSRFAETVPLGPCADLAGLADEANRVWQRMQWGYVAMVDLGQSLRITHRASPLSAALQLDADVSGGFLEGAYAAWLSGAGSPGELTLAQIDGSGAPMELVFELSAP